MISLLNRVISIWRRAAELSQDVLIISLHIIVHLGGESFR